MSMIMVVGTMMEMEAQRVGNHDSSVKIQK